MNIGDKPYGYANRSAELTQKNNGIVIVSLIGAIEITTKFVSTYVVCQFVNAWIAKTSCPKGDVPAIRSLFDVLKRIFIPPRSL